MHGLKLAVRAIRKTPAFTLAVIGMLALGIAGNTAIFSIFNGMFLSPLPFAEPERLVDLDETAPRWNLKFVGISDPDFLVWRDGNRVFDRMAVFSGRSFNLSGMGDAQRVRNLKASFELLDVLGLKPVLGRGFLPEEDRPGGNNVVLLGYDLWGRLFHRDRKVLGRILRLDEQPYVIVGVLPPEAVFQRAELWVPLQTDPNPIGRGWYLSGIGRLKQGVTIEQARADLLRVHKGMIASGRKVNEITSPVMMPLRDRILGDYRTVTRVLLGAVAIVLLIACVNVAALTLVRASARSREIAIRVAIGASRGSITRQLLTESLLLAAAGGALGVALGSLLLRAMVSLMPAENLPHWLHFTLDARFAIFSLLITGGAAVLFGVAPAIQAARIDPRSALQESGARASLSRRRRGMLASLVVCEISLALLLLVSAGLLLKAFHNVMHVDPGFRPENVISYNVSLPLAHYAKPESRVAFFRELAARTRAIPGVKAAGAASVPPLTGHQGNFFRAEGAPPLGPKEQDPVILTITATTGYFDAIGMNFLAGRPFDRRDEDPNAPAVAIVNETFAKHFWPHEHDVLGKRISFTSNKPLWMEVIGVARDTRHYGLDQEIRPSVFLSDRRYQNNSMGIVLRGSVDPNALVAPAREVLRRLDPGLPMFDIRTMSERLELSLWARRAYSWLFGAFAAVALLLAAAGIYGVISYTVAQRTHEIGIRIALGARPSQVLRQVLATGMRLAATGVAIGLAGAYWAGDLLKSLLFGVTPGDPQTYAAVISGVIAVALLANLIPARRAASVDPTHSLRID
jgi:predicted permease